MPKTLIFFSEKRRGSCDSIIDIDDGHSYSWPALDQLSHLDDTMSLSGNSLSPSSSIMQTFYEDKEKDVRIGINHFNRFDMNQKAVAVSIVNNVRVESVNVLEFE